jgi:PadR family transcriptional regulator AphA
MTGPTTTESALLGLLALEGERSPYDLVKAVQGSIGYFFAPARSHVYEVLPRMERLGWVEHRDVRQAGRPDKRVYRVTDAGREALVSWLEAPDDEEDRAVLLLKLYCGELIDPSYSLARLEAVRAWARERFERYLEIDVRNAGNDAETFPLLTLRHGIEHAAATMRWADEALARLRLRAAANG